MRKVELVEGEFYHLYNRGNSKQKIFNHKSDFERFVNLLFLANSKNSFNKKGSTLWGIARSRFSMCGSRFKTSYWGKGI